MSSRLSEAAAYGYITISISKSPSLNVLADLVLQEEPVDIQQAVARGVLSVDYLRISKARDIEEVDEAIYQFYVEFFKELIKYLPGAYSRYVEVFLEVFDIDRVASLIMAGKSYAKSPRYLYSKLGLYMDMLTASVDESKIGYALCAKSDTPIVCLYDKFIQRVSSALKSLSRHYQLYTQTTPIDIELSTDSIHLFTLLRVYSYILNEQKLKSSTTIDVDSLIRKYSMSRWVLESFRRVTGSIDSYLRKKPSLLIAFEAKELNSLIKDKLLYSPTLLDRLTYLLIDKFYESMLLRFIASKGLIRW